VLSLYDPQIAQTLCERCDIGFAALWVLSEANLLGGVKSVVSEASTDRVKEVGIPK